MAFQELIWTKNLIPVDNVWESAYLVSTHQSFKI